MRSNALLLLLLGALIMTLTHAGSNPPFYDWKLHILSGYAISKGAVCLDGSPPGYYQQVGTEPGKTMIHFQGGGWCTSPENCAGRANSSLGSSKNYAHDKVAVLSSYDGGAHGLFSSNSTVNPRFWNWTKVYVRYCDGASFGGNVEEPQMVNGQKIYFRGRRILDAVLDDLIQGSALQSNTDFFVNGCSAGGLSIWLHLDYITQRVTTKTNKIQVYGIPECGLFMDEPNAQGQPDWTPIYESVDRMQNVTGSGSVDAGCLATMPAADRSKCFIAQYNLPHVTTPFFAVNSVYDSWQGGNILSIPATCIRDPAQCSKQQTAAYERLRVDMLSNFTSAPPISKGDSTAFTYNCATHCGQFNYDDRWDELMNSQHSMSLRETFTKWYDDVRSGQKGAGKGLMSTAPKGWGPGSQATCT